MVLPHAPHRGAHLVSPRRRLAFSLQLKLLLMHLFFLLVPHILLHHFTVQPNRINAVPFGPEVVSPIRLLAHRRKHIEQPDRLRPFRTPIKSEIDNFGGTLTSKCTWSIWTFDSTTSHPNRWQNTITHLYTSRPTGPFSTRNRYFGTQTR